MEASKRASMLVAGVYCTSDLLQFSNGSYSSLYAPAQCRRVYRAVPVPQDLLIQQANRERRACHFQRGRKVADQSALNLQTMAAQARSEEHTSELQSHLNLVCRLL